MLYLAKYEDQVGFTQPPSTANDWNKWLEGVVPFELDGKVRNRLYANLRHILVGLEMKAALVVPHANREPGTNPPLFESYATILIFEFCVGAFSVCEGLGSAFYLRNSGKDGADSPRINPADWIAALVGEAGANNDLELRVRKIKEVRDKIHQDRLGAREEIDWHKGHKTD